MARRSARVSLGDVRGVNAEVVGAVELQAVLARMLRDTENLTRFWPLYHEAFKDAEREWFATEGGGTWAALSKRYARWKAKRYGRRGILQLTTTLAASLSLGGAWHIFETEPRYMRTGTRDSVANIHFSKKNRKKRRPMDVRSEVMQRHMVEAVRKHIAEYERLWGGARA